MCKSFTFIHPNFYTYMMLCKCQVRVENWRIKSKQTKISKVIAQRSLKKRQISKAKMEDNGRGVN
jgi:hypothetical protein